jgi:hypothetical protein
VTICTHPFGLLNVLQAGLESVVAAAAAQLFSQCKVVWRSFPQARDSECRSFDSHWCFIFTKCGSSVSARFLSHRAHTLWFRTLVVILDLSGTSCRDSDLITHCLVFHPFL